MAIISASRRTDIPTFYSDWFLNRLDAGEVYVRNNPYNPNAVSHITFTKEDIDCIVFWTKNPLPMMSKLDRLDGYQYYFQFTLTGYGEDMEGGLPEKLKLIEAFRKLSADTHHRVVWRYDPIVFTSRYTMEWHLKMFGNLARALAGFTDRCVISFVDMYGFARNNMNNSGIFNQEKSKAQLIEFCRKLAEIAGQHGMKVFTCAEEICLDETGVQHGSCIDRNLIEQYVGYPLEVKKDKGQRAACMCAESVDFGKYSTCRNGCKYCYACKNPADLKKNLAMYDVNSPLLCDRLNPADIITEKPLKTLRAEPTYSQLSFL